jgi:hypothetical protein
MQKSNLALALRTLQRASNRRNRREFLLSPRTVAVNRHRVSGSRDRGEPIARLRDFGTRLHNEAHFPYGFCDWLLCCREHHHILARISSERRCAKREYEYYSCTSNRPAAGATQSAFYFHGLIVSPPTIVASLFHRLADKEQAAAVTEDSVRPKKMLEAKIVKTRFCFFASAASGRSELIVHSSGRFPL